MRQQSQSDSGIAITYAEHRNRRSCSFQRLLSCLLCSAAMNTLCSVGMLKPAGAAGKNSPGGAVRPSKPPHIFLAFQAAVLQAVGGDGLLKRLGHLKAQIASGHDAEHASHDLKKLRLILE